MVKKMETTVVYWGYIGGMVKKMEAAIRIEEDALLARMGL